MTNLRIETIKISSLTPDPTNARRHDSRNLDSIKGSLKLFGQRKPIVVTGANVIVAGNGTVEAAKDLGWSEILTVRTPIDWTPEQVKAYALADNRTAELAEWDAKILADQLVELDAVGWDVAEFGFDPINPPTESEDDEPLSFDETPLRTKLGDIWELGQHRLMCADATDESSVSKLMLDKKADMAFTDPPYGIDFKSSGGKTIQNDNLDAKQLQKFNQDWQKVIYKFCKENSFLLAWASPRLFYLLDFQNDWKFFRLLTMYKPNRISFPHGAWINKTEPCLVFTKGKPIISKDHYLDDCFVYKHEKESHQDSDVGHPTPKPVKMVMEHIKACTKPTAIVIDLFGGSGSTMMACEKLDRSCYMMELDPKYCDVILKRWENLTGKTAERLES
jgi:site-specific DNA-methyltransferase (adenine-specific)